MTANSPDSAELLEYARKSGHLPLLLSQLKKDYERANIPFPLRQGKKGDQSPGEILQSLRENLYLLLMERFDQYLNLMYAADVPEREFRAVQLTDAVEVASQVTFILLKREWKKIEFRSRQGGESS